MTQTAPGPAPLRMLWQFYMQDPLTMFREAAQQYGEIVRFEAAGYTLYQFIHPDHIQQIAQREEQYEMSENFGQASPFVGRGLATNSGESWKRQRRLIQPAFNHQHLTPFVEIITGATTRLLDRWSQFQTRDVAPDLVRLNHQMLALAALSLDFEQHPALLADLAIVREFLTSRFQAMVAIPDQWPTPRNRRFWAAVRRLDEQVYREIQAREGGNIQRVDFLELFRQAEDQKTGERMNATQLHDEINTLLFNGYEDVGGCLTWALYLLAQNPAAEATLRAEVEAVLGSRVPTLEDLPRLIYTRMVINETLRLYPPTWSIMRDVLADDEIAGYPIPKGASILINIFLAHRHPAFWEEAERFDPERFPPGRTDLRHRFAYLPFGMGTRQCVGRNLALMQLHLILPMLIQRYRYTLMPGHPVVLDPHSSLRPRHGMVLQLERA